MKTWKLKKPLSTFLLCSAIICFFPSRSPVYGRDHRGSGNERLTAFNSPSDSIFRNGTPLQSALRQDINDRASQGLSTPSEVNYEINVLEQTDQRTLISGCTEIHFANPNQAGYVNWPDLVVSEDTATRLDIAVQGQVIPGDYNQTIQDAVASLQPTFWEENEYGSEPRTIVIRETYEIVGEGQRQMTTYQGNQSSLSSVTHPDSVLFGFTYVGPDIHYHIAEELKIEGITVARASFTFILDWGMGLRFPFEVTLTSLVDEAIQGATLDFTSTISPTNWDENQYNAFGVPAEEGNEFVLRFEFQSSFRLWIVLVGDVINLSTGQNFNESKDFTPPFYPDLDFPIDTLEISPEETGLTWGYSDGYTATVGVGFDVTPHVYISSLIEADWQAEADAQGKGEIVYTNLDPISFGPVLIADASPDDFARVRLSNFSYGFQTGSYVDITGMLQLNLLGYKIDVADFPIGRVDLWSSPTIPFLDIHPGTDDQVMLELPVDIPLDVQKWGSAGVVQANEFVTFTTRVTNQGSALLSNVLVNDSHCGAFEIGELPGGDFYEYTCQVEIISDLGSSVTATASGPNNEPYSDTAMVFVYVPDGIVGDGSPQSCTEEALDIELNQSSKKVITFDCGPELHAIGLTNTKVSPPNMTLIGNGVIVLDGQHQHRVFEVPAGSQLTLQGLIIANGWAHRPDNAPDAEGGGGILNFGVLTMEDCSLLNNSADYGGGIHNQSGGVLILRRTDSSNNQAIDFGGCVDPCTIPGGDGGGLYNASYARVSQSYFSDNFANGGGAIINWEGGQLLLQNDTILENNLANNGGALENGNGGQVEIQNATLAHNTSQFMGGAIINFESGEITINQSRLINNQSTFIENPDYATGGGAIFNFPGGEVVLTYSQIIGNSAHYGAGIHNKGDMTITNSTFTRNFAINDGAGAYNEGHLNIQKSTFGGSDPFDSNHAVGGGALINWGETSQLTIQNSTLQGNQADNGGALENGGGGEMFVFNTRLLDNSAHFIGGGIVNYDTGQVVLRDSVLTGNKAGVGGGIHNYQDGVILARAKTIIASNFADQIGGGLYNNNGTLTLEGCIIRDNHVGDDEPKDPQNDDVIWGGGGIYNRTGQVTTTDCFISGNQGGYFGMGGGIYNQSGGFTLVNTRVNNNKLGYHGLGGGIFNQSGTFDLTDSEVSNNEIINSGVGGGIYNVSGTFDLLRSQVASNQSLAMGSAGGIHNESGNLTMIESTVIGNRAESGFGGGINNIQGVMELFNSQVKNNTAIGEGAVGGGIRNLSGDLTLASCTIAGNTASGSAAGSGGGIYNYGGMLTIDTSNIHDNHVSGHEQFFGGGIYNNNGQVRINQSSVTKNSAFGQAGGQGGGIYNETGSIALENSTVSGNWVQYQSQGGGLYNANGSLTIDFSTIAYNTAYYGGGIYGDANLHASIVAYNLGVIDGRNCGTPVTTASWNIENGDSCNLISPYDFINTDPLLNPLNTCCGTYVHTLMESSPAIDRIPYRLCSLLEDQCDNPRPHSPGQNCDIGSFELP